MKKFVAGLLSTLMLFSCAACAPDQSQEEKPDPDAPVLAKDYDFGDPSLWAGEELKKINLGNAVFDAFPEDHYYDWGQSIMWDEQDQVYKMWWCRQSRYDSIWYAESKDLKNWHSLEKVLVVEPGHDTTWIKMHVGKPSVIKVRQGDSYEYRMYFEAPATLKQGGSIEYNNSIFLATSRDGKAWDVWSNGGDEPYPVIRMTDEQIAASNQQSEERGDSYGYYGFGQPSVTQKDGVYYLYYTHSLINDAMYVAKSTDGIHFTDHAQVFTRASSGVKYNTLTQKFMFTWALDNKVRYMESDDGYHFTYENVADAQDAETISIGVTKVRGYPDFVCNELGQVVTHTCYAAYMEGVDPGNGQDFRLRSDTWNIHIQAFHVKEFANRTMVLPNGYINTPEAKNVYDDVEFVYEDKRAEAVKSAAEKTPDGVKSSLYDGAEALAIDRFSYRDCAVPGTLAATVHAAYTEEALYLYLEVNDRTIDADDSIWLLIGEEGKASSPEQTSVIAFRRESAEAVFTDGTGAAVTGQSRYAQKDGGYVLEVRLPWRSGARSPGTDLAFDCFVYDRYDSTEYKTKLCWNDMLHDFADHSIEHAGSLVLS